MSKSANIRLVKTCYPQACCKLFEQLAASLRITTCSKPDFLNSHQHWCSIRLVKTWYPQPTWCKLMKQVASSLQMTTCSKPEFLNLYQHWCVHQTCCKLFHQTCQNLISTDLMQVDETTSIKSANDNLQQLAWISQLVSALMRSSDLLQVVLSGLLQVDICRLAW
jgi:3-hydroxy-3-methylglutaryl CoA synthase